MADTIRSERLCIDGMTCVSCQTRIERVLRGTNGVRSATVSYSGGYANVTYDTDVVKPSEVRAVIEQTGYTVLSQQQSAKTSVTNTKRVVGLVILIAALYLLLSQLNLIDALPLAEAGMSYGMLFVIGLITSVHCIAMCGGINLTQCIPQTGGSPLRASVLYNVGRVVSYTVVGFIVGAIGSVITLDGAFTGVVQLIAGVFMVIMGVNMLGIFPWLRKFTPHMPSFLSHKVNIEKSKSNSPLIVGLLNGLMPCGPLQAMQLYALSTGSPIQGAVSMLLFSLGTVPLMFGLGALSSLLTKKFTQKVMTMGAVLVTVLGLTMFSQGAALSGFSLDGLLGSFAVAETNNGTTTEAENAVVDGVQLVASTLKSGSYPKITVQAGIPVKWTIDAPQGTINGCNKSIVIPEYNIQYSFKQGENILEFTPDKTGSFRYSCWMGMIRGTITVVEQSSLTEQPSAEGGESPSSSENNSPTEPTTAALTIPTDTLAIAERKTKDYNGTASTYQSVKITLTDNGFSPAVVVVQSGVDVEWIIDFQGSDWDKAVLRIPLYVSEIPLDEGENPLGFSPEEDFQFGNGDDTAFGYVKVVDSLDSVDADAIKSGIAAFTPTIYPENYYEQSSSCH